MIETQILSLALQYGFPAVLVVYLLVTRDKVVSKNTEALKNLQTAITMLSERFKK